MSHPEAYGADGIVGSSSVPASGTDTKPLPQLPPLETTTKPGHKSKSSYSPSTKRKPLPASASTPPPGGPQATATLDHQNTTTTSPSHSQPGTLVPQTPKVQHNTAEEEPQPHSEHVSRADSDPEHEPAYYIDSPLSTVNRVSLVDFPVPPRRQDSLAHRAHVEGLTAATQEEMGLRPGERPPPLRMESLNSVKSLEARKTSIASPGVKFTSFFMRKPVASPGTDSATTDFSETKSPAHSPHPRSEHSSTGSAIASYFNIPKHTPSQPSQDSIPFQRQPDNVLTRCNALEAELKEISIELAGSIRRELDLEDLVEKLQAGQHSTVQTDRSSDYFSDYGTISSRMHGGEFDSKDEIDKIKRDADQKRAAQRIELSQKWQEEVTQRKNLESHSQQLEEQLHMVRRSMCDGTDSRVRELELIVDDHRRKLLEERNSKKNFEDLYMALQEELAQYRSEKDNLRDEVVPQLRAQVEGLEATLAETQRQPYDLSKLQQELQGLRDENAALASARESDRSALRNSMHLISEEDNLTIGSKGLSRSNTLIAGRGQRGGLARTGSLSRASSTLHRGAVPSMPGIDNTADQLKAVEQQRDALHNTVKYLLRRQDLERQKSAKRAKMLETEVERTNAATPKHKGGYEREVRMLRSEINTLRKRADDALDQKWQCEKGLAGLKMDLDRNKAETASLQRLLQVKGSDTDAQDLMCTSLETAIVELQKERARTQEDVASIEQEEHLSTQLEESAARSEALSSQVKKQLQSNAALRARLRNAVELGEQNQRLSTDQISLLQEKLKKLEDQIMAAQIQSETAVMKHEEEIHVLRASHNASLMRAMSVNKRKSNLALLTPTARSPMSPMFVNSKKSPKLDKTSSGPGIALHEALRTEYLENKVSALEQALADAETEMGEVVGRMNTAQIGVAELEAERDEALQQTRRLEEAVQLERGRYAELLKTLDEW